MFRWVVHLPSPYRIVPGLHPGLFPEIFLLHGFWRYWVMSCHFEKHLMRQTKLWEQIFDLGARSRVADGEGGTWRGLIFWELFNIYKIKSLWNLILSDLSFVFWFDPSMGGRWVAMYVFVLHRNPNRWTDLDKIWHVGGRQEQEGSWGGFNPVPPTYGYGVDKGGIRCL